MFSFQYICDVMCFPSKYFNNHTFYTLSHIKLSSITLIKNISKCELYRSVANHLSEIDHQECDGENELGEDIEMASIAEEEDELDEKFSHQGTSTGKHSGKKKVVSKS